MAVIPSHTFQANPYLHEIKFLTTTCREHHHVSISSLQGLCGRALAWTRAWVEPGSHTCNWCIINVSIAPCTQSVHTDCVSWKWNVYLSGNISVLNACSVFWGWSSKVRLEWWMRGNEGFANQSSQTENIKNSVGGGCITEIRDSSHCTLLQMRSCTAVLLHRISKPIQHRRMMYYTIGWISNGSFVLYCLCLMLVPFTGSQ